MGPDNRIDKKTYLKPPKSGIAGDLSILERAFVIEQFGSESQVDITTYSESLGKYTVLEYLDEGDNAVARIFKRTNEEGREVIRMWNRFMSLERPSLIIDPQVEDKMLNFALENFAYSTKGLRSRKIFLTELAISDIEFAAKGDASHGNIENLAVTLTQVVLDLPAGGCINFHDFEKGEAETSSSPVLSICKENNGILRLIDYNTDILELVDSGDAPARDKLINNFFAIVAKPFINGGSRVTIHPTN